VPASLLKPVKDCKTALLAHRQLLTSLSYLCQLIISFSAMILSIIPCLFFERSKGGFGVVGFCLLARNRRILNCVTGLRSLVAGGLVAGGPSH
jgi:hypothetical protein